MRNFKKWLALFTAAAMVATSLPGSNLTVSAATANEDSVIVEDSLKAEDALYSQDFETASSASDVGAESTNAQDSLTIANDEVHGKYLKFALPGDSNSRGAVMNFTGVDVSSLDSYIVELDAAIAPGGNQETHFAIKGTDFTYVGNNINYGVGSGYLLSLTNGAGGSTTYTVNGIASATVTIPSGEWCHYKVYVDKSLGLISTTITDSSSNVIADKLTSAYDGTGNVAGLYMLAGRYSPVGSMDNIVVRTVTDEDEFGELPEETLTSAEFTSALNTTITQPALDAPVHYPITVKANGSLGGDLTEQADIQWSVVGTEGEDGYISLTKEQGTGAGTEGEAPDGATAYFNVRNGVSTWFGYVQAVVTYGDESYTVKTPFAVIGESSSGAAQLAPQTGYPEDMGDYADTLVGYQATANGINEKDLILGWSIYGSNTARTLTLVEEDDTKSLEFASNGGSGSTVGVYQWVDQTSQYVIDFTAKFPSGMGFGVYAKTPNNGDNNPEWTASVGSGALTAGTETISGIDSGKWYRYVISADPSIQEYTVAVYDAETGAKLGETAEIEMTNDASSQVYFCFQGTLPMYLKSFKAYKPAISEISVAADADVVKVPEGTEPATTVDLSASLADAAGLKITGAVTWSLGDEYANVELTSTGAQTATLTVNEGASGIITVVATKDGKQAETEIQLTTSSNVVAFTKSTSSITIPFDGEEKVVVDFAAETRDGNGAAIEGGVITYTLLGKDGAVETTVNGVTLNESSGQLIVSPGASPAVVYIKAVNEEGLSTKVKVSIHGLSFAFGSDDPAEGLTQVANTQYTEKLGYGFLTTDGLTVNADNVTGTSVFRFKANVPNGNYTVTVNTTADSLLSEVVEAVSASTGITKTGSTFSVAVCDGVLDLTFPADSSVSTLTISQAAAKTALDKPAVYVIGDSTANNTASGAKSWGNCVADRDVTLPDCFSSFSNYGFAGKNSVSYYNLARVETVLLSICPGDYVTVNMGINSETGEAAAYYTLLKYYYIEGIIQRGGIPVIVTATPLGFSDSQSPYDTATGKFLTSRDNYGNGARNDVLRQIAEEEGLTLIELGRYFEDYMNNLTDADVTAYNAAQGTDCATVLDMVKDWYVDHNHYKQYLGVLIGNYLLGELKELQEYYLEQINSLNDYKDTQIAYINTEVAADGDSAAVTDMITTAIADIQAITFINTVAADGLETYKAEVDAIVSTLVSDVAARRAAEAENANNIAAFDAYKENKLAEVQDKGIDGDSAAVKALIAEAETAIEKLYYDVDTTLDENKGRVDTIVTDLTDAIEAKRSEEAASIAAFNEYKTAQIAEADNQAAEGDSDAVTALIEAAKAAIEALDYDMDLTLSLNKKAVDEIITQLKSDIAEQKEAENGGGENPSESENPNDSENSQTTETTTPGTDTPDTTTPDTTTPGTDTPGTDTPDTTTPDTTTPDTTTPGTTTPDTTTPDATTPDTTTPDTTTPDTTTPDTTTPDTTTPDTTTPDTTTPDTGAAEPEVPAAPAKGDVLSKGANKYKVTVQGKEVSYAGAVNKKATTVKIPATVSIGEITYNVTSVANKALQKNTYVKTITIGKNVTSIGTSAFASCTNLIKVTFSGTSKCATIGNKAFYGDKKLTTITLPNSVTKIGTSAFASCIKLKSVTIGTGLKEIGKTAFSGDKNLSKITIKSTKLTKVGKKALEGTRSNITIKVPKKKVADYKKLFNKAK